MDRAGLKNIVAAVLEVDPRTLNSQTDLNSIEAFDSVSILTLMITLDEQAGIKVSPSEANMLRFYSDIERMAEKQGVLLSE